MAGKKTSSASSGTVIGSVGGGPSTTTSGNTGVATGLTYSPTTVSGAGGATVGKTKTVTEEYLQPDITSTQFVANSVYQNLMGRNATADEVQKYHQQFLDYAKTHPILSKVSQYDASTGLLAPVRDVTAQKSTLTEADFINNIVRQGSEAKEYNAATTYFDAMRQAMGSFRGGY